jgi:hypothetical protein
MRALRTLAIATALVATLTPAVAGKYIPNSVALAAFQYKFDDSKEATLLKGAFIAQYELICLTKSHVAPSAADKAANDWANTTALPKRVAERIANPNDQQPYTSEELAFDEALGIAADWYAASGHVKFCADVRFDIIRTFEK